MKRLVRGIVVVIAIAVAVVLAPMALIEVGREVAVLRTRRADGTWRESRLWIVDDGGSCWLHSGGADWKARFAGDPIVEVERDGVPRRYQSHFIPGPHPRVHELLREKYGIADRWVRFIGPDREDTVAVRLDPID